MMGWREELGVRGEISDAQVVHGEKGLKMLEVKHLRLRVWNTAFQLTAGQSDTPRRKSRAGRCYGGLHGAERQRVS